MKVAISVVLKAIAKENTQLKPKFKFMVVIGVYVRPIGTHENFQEIIIIQMEAYCTLLVRVSDY
jgi:hypothetical protein